MAATTSGVKRPYAQISGAPERPSVRSEFRLLPVADSVKRGVQQTVLELIFAGRDVDTSRCEWWLGGSLGGAAGWHCDSP